MKTTNNALNSERLFALVDAAFAVDPASTINVLKLPLMLEPVPPLLVFPVALHAPVHIAAMQVRDDDIVLCGAKRTFATCLNSAAAECRVSMALHGVSPLLGEFDEDVRNEAEFWDQTDDRHLLLMIAVHKLIGVIAGNTNSTTN